MMKIALDIMSGDNSPEEIIEGALLYINKTNEDLILVGEQQIIANKLKMHPYERKKIEIVHTTQIIGMNENPLSAYREKKDSSIVVGCQLVREKKAIGFYSPGNTGAVLTAALFEVGRIKGIKRPALAAILPNAKDFTILIDAGANTDCKPNYLLQFAVMGEIFLEKVFKKNRPRVGILNNGEEDLKGTALTKNAHSLLSNTSLNYIGNIEGYNLIDGSVDVVVSDGFTGNVALKTIEGTAKIIMKFLKLKINQNLVSKIGGMLLKNGLLEIKEVMDPREYGGAPLLGIDGEIIVGHGNSDSLATYNGLRLVKRMVEVNVKELIEKRIHEF